jgi:hypothetical protein
MWAVGATETGLLPLHGDSARQCRDNLDKLTALFGQSAKLLNVVQISSRAFGAENALLNPAFGGSTTTRTSYENAIVNPSFRSKAFVTSVSNLFANPTTVTETGTWTTTYENLVKDPYSKL